MKKNNFAKLDLFLCVSWGVLAAFNLVEYFTSWDWDKFLIASLQALLCMKDYFEYKESVK
jgi:hypothetical protein